MPGVVGEGAAAAGQASYNYNSGSQSPQFLSWVTGRILT